MSSHPFPHSSANVFDDHGAVVDSHFPTFLQSHTLERWCFCVVIAAQATDSCPGRPENTMYATELFTSDLPCGNADDEYLDAERAAIDAGLVPQELVALRSSASNDA